MVNFPVKPWALKTLTVPNEKATDKSGSFLEEGPQETVCMGRFLADNPTGTG